MSGTRLAVGCDAISTMLAASCVAAACCIIRYRKPPSCPHMQGWQEAHRQPPPAGRPAGQGGRAVRVSGSHGIHNSRCLLIHPADSRLSSCPRKHTKFACCCFVFCAGCSDDAPGKVYKGITAVWRALKQLFSAKLWAVTVVLIVMWVSAHSTVAAIKHDDPRIHHAGSCTAIKVPWAVLDWLLGTLFTHFTPLRGLFHACFRKSLPPMAWLPCAAVSTWFGVFTAAACAAGGCSLCLLRTGDACAAA